MIQTFYRIRLIGSLQGTVDLHQNKERKQGEMLRIKTSCMVKPASPTPNVHLWLPECDQITPLTHAPTVYFYHPIGDSYASAFETLKDSLSQVLVPFFPVAGRLHWINERNRLELHCNGIGALVLEAESEAEMADFGDFCPTPEIRKLIPPVEYESTDISEQPVLLVQLTRFRCGGLCLGTALSHVVVDGVSALHFFNSWAKIARNENFDLILPSNDRSAFYKGDPTAKPRFRHVEFDDPPLLIGENDDKQERLKESTVALIKLSKEQVDKLKKNANEGNTTNREYSRYETLTGHIWRCVCKSRKLNEEQLTKLRIPVNSRNRLQPSLPNNYFGNGVVTKMPIAKSVDLLSNPLSYAASLVKEAVKLVDDEYIRSAMDFLSSHSDLTPFRSSFHSIGCTMGIFLGNPNLAVTSWIGFPVYGADFGWGKPFHMGPGAIGSDGKFFIVPGGDEEGSISIFLRLQVAHMADFINYFYKDISD